MRGGRFGAGFVAITGGGGLDETGIAGGEREETAAIGLGEIDFGSTTLTAVPVVFGDKFFGETGLGMALLVVSGESSFPGDELRVRILASFSANSFVTPSWLSLR